MKKLGFILLVVFLVGCAPSEAVIQTAIANTQKAIPTPTSAPTPTSTPSPTSTPLPDIKTLIITQPELDSIMPGFYNTSMMIIEDTYNPNTLAQVFTGAYRTSLGVGTISISLIKAQNSSQSSGFIHDFKNEFLPNGKDVSLPNIVLPKDTWAASTTEKHLMMGFSQSNVAILIDFALLTGVTAESGVYFVSLAAQAQSTKLANAGYK